MEVLVKDNDTLVVVAEYSSPASPSDPCGILPAVANAYRVVVARGSNLTAPTLSLVPLGDPCSVSEIDLSNVKRRNRKTSEKER